MSFESGKFPAQMNQPGGVPGSSGPPAMTQGSGPAPGSTMDVVRPPAYGRGIIVSLGSAASVFVLAIMASGETPTSTGVPLTETTTPLFWGIAVIFCILCGFGAQYSEFTASRAADSLGAARRRTSIPTAWTIPVAAEATAILMVATFHNRLMLIAGPAIAFLGVAGGLLARDLLDDAYESNNRTASTMHIVILHLVAFLALSAVYLNKMSGWLAAPMVAALAGVLILESLDRNGAEPMSAILYTLLGAGAMGQIVLAIAWWPTHGWTGGAALLVCFFSVNGLLSAQITRKTVGERELIEFGLVSVVGLAIIAFTL
jgi:Protein of unknown function (DUF5656)